MSFLRCMLSGHRHNGIFAIEPIVGLTGGTVYWRGFNCQNCGKFMPVDFDTHDHVYEIRELLRLGRREEAEIIMGIRPPHVFEEEARETSTRPRRKPSPPSPVHEPTNRLETIE